MLQNNIHYILTALMKEKTAYLFSLSLISTISLLFSYSRSFFYSYSLFLSYPHKLSLSLLSTHTFSFSFSLQGNTTSINNSSRKQKQQTILKTLLRETKTNSTFSFTLSLSPRKLDQFQQLITDTTAITSNNTT